MTIGPGSSSARAAHRNTGFSLVEALVAVGIVAILATIATGAYRGYVLRANRTEGRNAILRMQMAQERFYLQNGTYATALTSAPPTGLGMSASSTENGFYTLTVGAGTTGDIATSYLATATAAGSQTADKSACRVFSVDETGRRTPDASSDCWK